MYYILLQKMISKFNLNNQYETNFIQMLNNSTFF